MNSLNNIGLAFRARKLISGAEMVISKVKNKEVALVLLATDASINTKKMIYDKASYYNVPVIEAYSSSELSNAIGLKGRMVLGITNKGFAKTILEKENMR